MYCCIIQKYFLGTDTFSGTSIMSVSPTSKYIFDLVQVVILVVRCYTQLADMIDLSAPDVP